MALYELRRYEIKPGKMAEWLTLFDEEILPFQTARGMVVAGIFSGEDDEQCFYWIRRFEDEADRVRLYAAVYEDPAWKANFHDRIGALMNREAIQVTRLTPSAMSVLR